MVGAWWLAVRSQTTVAKPLNEQVLAVARTLAGAQHNDPTAQIYLNRLLDAEIHLRAIQNQQTLSVVAMSVAFALMAIGFALFVMGAEGAFLLQGDVPNRGNFVLKSTAPGLLCFLLSASLVWIALTGRLSFSNSAFRLQPESAPAAVLSHDGVTSGPLVPELPDGMPP